MIQKVSANEGEKKGRIALKKPDGSYGTFQVSGNSRKFMDPEGAKTATIT